MCNPSVSPSLPNRWVIAIAAFFVQLSLGSVYAWSVFLPHVIDIYHVPKLSANTTLSITLAALGIMAGFGGLFQSRYGRRPLPRPAASSTGWG